MRIFPDVLYIPPSHDTLTVCLLYAAAIAI
jgi:hypothetical protein